MNNKSKKILAGLGLALVGGATLAGCSMSDEQQAALDKVVDKADEIIELVENNMAMENNQLSKQEAYEMIILSNNALKFGLIDQIELKITGKEYYNYFEKEKEFQPDDQILKFRMKDQTKYYELLTKDGEESDSLYVIADYKNDIYHYWNTWSTEEKSMQYEETIQFTIGGDLLQFIDISSFTVEDIYNISVTDNNEYVFTMFTEYTEDNYNYSKRYDIVVKDNLLRKAEQYGVCEKTAGAIETQYCCVEFNYDNIDFSALDAKYADLLDS